MRTSYLRDRSKRRDRGTGWLWEEELQSTVRIPRADQDSAGSPRQHLPENGSELSAISNRAIKPSRPQSQVTGMPSPAWPQGRRATASGLHTVLHFAIDPFLLLGKAGGRPMAEHGLLGWTSAWQELLLTPATLGAFLVTYIKFPTAASGQQSAFGGFGIQHSKQGMPCHLAILKMFCADTQAATSPWTADAAEMKSCKQQDDCQYRTRTGGRGSLTFNVLLCRRGSSQL